MEYIDNLLNKYRESKKKQLIEKSISAFHQGIMSESSLKNIIEKARSGRYADNAENQRLKRVGQEYGTKGKEDDKNPKDKKQDEQPKDKQTTGDLTEQAKNSSIAQLEAAIKESNSPEVRQAAHNEIARREKEEHVTPDSEKKFGEDYKKESDQPAKKDDKSKSKDSEDKQVEAKKDSAKEIPSPITIQDYKQVLDKLFKENNIKADFKGLSDAHGISIYYDISGKKVRFSNHSVTSKDRIENEIHFELPIQKVLGRNPKTGKLDFDNPKIIDNRDNILNSLKDVSVDTEKKPIEADKKESKSTSDNKEGKEISKEQREKNFKEWFGDSKVVDENGKPLIVYHGTTNDFNKFDSKFGGTNTTKAGKLGFFFTEDVGLADDFTKKDWVNSNSRNKKSASIVPVFLSIKNPKQIDVRRFTTIRDYNEFKNYLIEDGYDGVIIKPFTKEEKKEYDSIFSAGFGDISKEFNKSQYIAFNSNQIKSATGNDGNFSSESNDITKSEEQDILVHEFSGNIDIEKANELKGGLADKLSINDIAKKHKVDIKQIKEQVKKGISVEMEHTDEPSKALEITLDHLTESPVYYDELEKMEKKFDKDKKDPKDEQ